MEAFLPDAAARAVSPGLAARLGGNKAYELKFQILPEMAKTIETWARSRLAPDPHGRDGTYRINTVYCDTPSRDVYHRSPGFRRSKYRLRRYGNGPVVYLERKTKRGDQVAKRRDNVPLEELYRFPAYTAPDAPGSWFLRRVQFRNLQPACCIAYDRTAFMGTSPDGPIRLTLDQNVIGKTTYEWEVEPLIDGRTLLPTGMILELKYHAHLPPVFRELLATIPANMPRLSKYRRCVQAFLAGDEF